MGKQLCIGIYKLHNEIRGISCVFSVSLCVYVCTYADLIHFTLIFFLITSVTGRCFGTASILKK